MIIPDDDAGAEALYKLLTVDISRYQVRTRFRQALARELANYGVAFVEADLTRTAAGDSVWRLTVLHNGEIEVLTARLDPGIHPYSQEAGKRLVNGLRSWASRTMGP